MSSSRAQSSEAMLSDELWSTILGFVPPLEVLRNAVLVSRQLHRVIDQSCFWSLHPLAVSSSNTNHNNNKNDDLNHYLWSSLLNKHQWQRLCLWVAAAAVAKDDPDYNTTDNDDDDDTSSQSTDVSNDANELRMETSLSSSTLPTCLKPRSVLSPYRKLISEIGRGVCIASSTDNWSEAIDNVLVSKKNTIRPTPQEINNTIFQLSTTWWSSRATPTTDTNETLLFVLKHPLTLVESIRIKALNDPYWRRHPPTYAWNQTIVRAYYVPPEELLPPNASSATATHPSHYYCSVALEKIVEGRSPPSGNDAIDRVLKNATLMYEKCFDEETVEDAKTHTFHLNTGKDDEASIVIGNVITLELVGKRNEQQTGMGYYACVEQLECFGVPLAERPSPDDTTTTK